MSRDVVPTTCWIGKQDCGMLAHRVDGRVVKFEGLPENPRNLGTLCPKGQAQIMALYDPNRVKSPLVRTNAKGEPGKWRKVSWDEALGLVADKANEVRARDKRAFVWQKGRSKGAAFYDDAFVKASGAAKFSHGAFCSDAGYRAAEYTFGPKGVLHPDFRFTKYLLSWGWNVTNGGGNQLCWITWPRQMVDAREQGLEMVVIDPRLRSAGPFADQWLPIRPGTDLAFALALAHELIANDTIDREYLTKYTNAPYLVDDEGHFLREGTTPLVWDSATGSPKPDGSPGVTPELEGTFDVAGTAARPAFQLLVQHLEQYTPEFASGICGIAAERIVEIAATFGEEARIGSTIVVDGVEVPYRPVAVMAYHVVQQELGFQTTRAMMLLPMLVGAMGAAGGQQIDVKPWSVSENFEKLDTIKIQDPPKSIELAASKYYPINSTNSSLAAHVMLDPKRYGVDYLPEVMIIHMANPMASFADIPVLEKAYRKLKFVAVIDPWMSRTADLYADVVLPAATLEKYEGPSSASDQYVDAITIRTPPMEPLFESRGEIDIYLDLCERMGILFGPGGYLEQLNTSLKLKAPNVLATDRKPTPRKIFDVWAKAEGIDEGVSYFEAKGVYVKGKIPPEKAYGYAMSPPFGGVKHRLYGESLLGYRETQQELGADEVYWHDYTPLPTWRRPTMEESPARYDLYLISFKLIEHKQSRSSQIPLLAELSGGQRLEINPKTAAERGIEDGDEVWVESHNAITEETRRVKTRARLREGIRPDTVGMPHHFGEVAKSPWTKGQGPSPNSLYFTGEGYVGATADQSFHVKVRVFKA
ncbi:MAG TPA: molybdopterin-dependent oxidoreductase [Acidimicrobiia bacterium]|nr:molybdopterin-dependent oxidoreductase [Acidimicrobiia bacterium]